MLIQETNRFYSGDDPQSPQAEIVFERMNPQEYRITHTFVDPSLRGQGVGAQLVDAVADLARKEGRKVSASCSYARALLQRRAQYADISLHQ